MDVARRGLGRLSPFVALLPALLLAVSVRPARIGDISRHVPELLARKIRPIPTSRPQASGAAAAGRLGWMTSGVVPRNTLPSFQTKTRRINWFRAFGNAGRSPDDQKEPDMFPGPGRNDVRIDQGRHKKKESMYPEIQPEWEQRTSRMQEDLAEVLHQYNILLRDCAKTSDWKRAMELFKELRTVGIEPDRDTYHGLVLALTKGNQAKRAMKVLVTMREKGIDLRVRVVKQPRRNDVPELKQVNNSSISAQAYQLREGDQAGSLSSLSPSTSSPLQQDRRMRQTKRSASSELPAMPSDVFFQDGDSFNALASLQMQEDLKPLLLEYNAMLKSAKKRGRWKDALRIFKDMRDLGIAPDIISYSTLLSALGRARQPELLLRVFRIMRRDRSVTPDMIAFSSLIDGLIRAERINEALGALEEMRRCKLRPNVFTYSSVISGLARMKAWGKAGELFMQMRSEGVTPDKVFFNSIVNACAKSNQLSKALEYYALMRETDVKPTPAVFSSLIIACARAQEPKLAERLFKEMKRARVKPDLVVYNAYIAALGSQGDLETAKIAVNNMTSEGVKPDIVTYNSLLRACEERAAMNGVEEAFDILQDIIDEGLEPDIYTYNTMLRTCVPMGDEGAAGEILAMMRKRGMSSGDSMGVTPDAVTYNALIRVYVNAGQQQRAVSLVRYLSRSGLEPGLSIYNTLLAGIVRSGYHRIAIQFLDEMIGNGLAPDMVTFNTVIDSCARAGDSYLALELLERMREFNLSPNIITYTSLMKAYKANGDTEGMWRVFKMMGSTGNVVPDLTTYTVALGVCAVNGKVGAAVRLIKDLERRGLTPNTYTYNIFLNVCARAGRWQWGLEAFRRMRRAGVEPDLATYDVLIRMCNRAQQWARSVELFEQMRISGLDPSEPILAELIKATENGGFLKPRAAAKPTTVSVNDMNSSPYEDAFWPADGKSLELPAHAFSSRDASENTTTKVDLKDSVPKSPSEMTQGFPSATAMSTKQKLPTESTNNELVSEEGITTQVSQPSTSPSLKMPLQSSGTNYEDEGFNPNGLGSAC